MVQLIVGEKGKGKTKILLTRRMLRSRTRTAQLFT